MRTLADFIHSESDSREGLVKSYLLREIIVAETLALAAYQGVKFNSLDDIMGVVRRTTGYPLKNRIKENEETLDVEHHAAKKIASLLGITTDEYDP